MVAAASEPEGSRAVKEVKKGGQRIGWKACVSEMSMLGLWDALILSQLFVNLRFMVS